VTRTFRGVAVSAVTLAVLAGCSDKAPSPTVSSEDSDRPTVTVTAQPQDADAAQLAVEQLFSLVVGDDWSSVYDLWTDEAQKQIPKDTYVNLISTCPDQGDQYKVTDVKTINDTTATVDWTREKPGGGEQAGSTTVRYEEGTWRVEPDPAALAAYKSGKCA
jgi:hypothetical protein